MPSLCSLDVSQPHYDGRRGLQSASPDMHAYAPVPADSDSQRRVNLVMGWTATLLESERGQRDFTLSNRRWMSLMWRVAPAYDAEFNLRLLAYCGTKRVFERDTS